jgi:hypothetical protein
VEKGGQRRGVWILVMRGEWGHGVGLLAQTFHAR